MKLCSYLAALMAGRILGSLLVLVGILQILDLLEVTTDILDRELGGGGIAYYALLRMPRLVEQAAPLAVLTGSLFAFAKLAQESAVTAMRSTGVSAYQITLMALPAAVVMAVVQLTISGAVAPRTDQTLSDWWRATEPAAEAKADAEKPDILTFRVGDEVMVGEASADGRTLSKLTIYRRDAAGRLTQRTHADSAVYDTGRWRLIAPRFETIQRDAIQTGSADEMDWRVKLTPEDLQMLRAGQPTVTPAEARRAVQGGVSVRPRTFYDTQLQRAWAAPAACLVMLLLAAPAALTNIRGGAPVLVLCLTGGLLVY